MNLKDLYINYFISKGHSAIKSAPLIPENDPTCLFNTAGMQPLVPYLMGKTHPAGTRLVDVQKCVRLTDLDGIGDTSHHTFFEMLGNWSLGDYFKKESITWSFEFLTNVLNIPIEKLAVTVFRGNDLVPRDEESAQLWLSLGIKEARIAYLGEDDNWWGPAGETGPCGPDTEIFYYRGDNVPEAFDPSDNNWLEIWNNVFMEYNKTKEGTFILLDKKNVDTGMGVERTVAVLEGYNDNYKSSIWQDIIAKIESISNLAYDDEKYTKSMRILADHIRTSVMIAGDNAKVVPSNTDQGYILRRLIRRAIRHAKNLNIDIFSDWDKELAELIINKYAKYYQELETNKAEILNVLNNEKIKFTKTLEKGLKEFEKSLKNVTDNLIDKDTAFRLYDTFGFPIELTTELALEQGLNVDVLGFNEKFKEHQEKSRAGATVRFKGGLSSSSEMNVKYHTATHLLNAALKQVLGNHVHQKGSNITDERMRFDFSHDSKVMPEELERVEKLVNEYIEAAYPVTSREVSKDEALNIGAEAMFLDKYGDIVTIYEIGDISKEFCGGPHVMNTNELGHFKILKEEASSAGVRRIKAILE